MEDSADNSFKQKFLKSLALFLPGIFLLGFNIDTGSVTSMAKAGAEYGMSLFWTIVVSCLCTFFMINLYGRYTLVTGQTALQAFRKNIHPAVGIFFLVALTAGVCGSVMGVMGIVAEICSEWSKTVLERGIAPIYFASFFVALVYFIFWKGKTQVFERSLRRDCCCDVCLLLDQLFYYDATASRHPERTDPWHSCRAR